MYTIGYMLNNCLVAPFESNNDELIKIFSFFLHLSPSISSNSSMQLDQVTLNDIWQDITNYIGLYNYECIPYNKSINSTIIDYNLDSNNDIRAINKAIVITNYAKEKEYEAFFRHIRNGIAHDHIYITNIDNTYYILLQDINTNKNVSARILLSLDDLKHIMDIIKNKQDN